MTLDLNVLCKSNYKTINTPMYYPNHNKLHDVTIYREIINQSDTSSSLATYFGPFANSARDTKYHKQCRKNPPLDIKALEHYTTYRLLLLANMTLGIGLKPMK